MKCGLKTWRLVACRASVLSVTMVVAAVFAACNSTPQAAVAASPAGDGQGAGAQVIPAPGGAAGGAAGGGAVAGAPATGAATTVPEIGAGVPPAGAPSVNLAGIKAVDLSPLTQPQRETFARVVQGEACDCACTRTLADCLLDAQPCTRAVRKAEYVLIGIAETATEQEIHEALKNDYTPSYCGEAKGFDLTSVEATSKGKADAPVTIVIFSDFECPFCSMIAPKLHAVAAHYGDKVRMVFKHFPLSFHARARLYAQATEAAARQGRFWDMHDYLFENQENMAGQNLTETAKKLGLDVERFKADLLSREVVEKVERDRAEGEAAGVEGTPAIFINGVVYNLPRELPWFAQRIDDILTKTPCCK